ncbi:unnamed protein product [marine sediment metagenome]|uniref:Uncharacterized protein n=1 Tax=marine sediment metagenome TaxID=412755 RepID=X1KI65_9ZZZZ
MRATPIIAIIAIVILEGIALWQHIDGAVLGIAFAAVSGLGGYHLKAQIEKRRKR